MAMMHLLRFLFFFLYNFILKGVVSIVDGPHFVLWGKGKEAKLARTADEVEIGAE